MTFLPYWVEQRSPSPRQRPARNPIRFAAGTVSCAVAFGTVVTQLVLPGIEGPGETARSYVEAAYDREWDDAFDMLCAENRESAGGEDGFVAYNRAWHENFIIPRNVRTDIERVQPHRDADAAPMWTVSVLVTPDVTAGGPSRFTLPVVFEEGGPRVCIPAGVMPSAL
jgi:hypothetical protein